MKTIWKYPISSSVCIVDIPKDAEILSVQLQKEIPCIWALVDSNNELEERIFEIYCTGQEVLDANLDYLGTFQLESKGLVFHLFEKL